MVGFLRPLMKASRTNSCLYKSAVTSLNWQSFASTSRLVNDLILLYMIIHICVHVDTKNYSWHSILYWDPSTFLQNICYLEKLYTYQQQIVEITSHLLIKTCLLYSNFLCTINNQWLLSFLLNLLLIQLYYYKLVPLFINTASTCYLQYFPSTL